MDGEDIEMREMNRDREEQREREENDYEDLDDRQQQGTDFGETSYDNGETSFLADFQETPKSHYISKKDSELINFIREEFKVRDFSFDGNDPNVLELRNRTEITSVGNIKFKPSGQTKYFVRKQVVLKVVKGELVFNESETSQRAVTKFKELHGDIVARDG